VGEFSKCVHIRGDIFEVVLNCCPAASQTTGEPRLDISLNGFTRVAHFSYKISQLGNKLIDLSILMLDPLPFHNVEVSAEGLTKDSSYEIKEA
jgi:hypothetical protein